MKDNCKHLVHQKKRLSIVAKSFLSVFFIVLLEGSVRKWFLPSAGIPLMLFRDLLVIGMILFGIQASYFKFRAYPEFLLSIWTLTVLVWSMLQFIFEIIPLPVVFIGFRFWVLYAWFALLCYRALKPYDVEKILKVILFTLLPMVILSVLQFLSPVDAFINKQAGGEDEYIFTVVQGIVRTTGTFTFSLGYTTYMALLLPLVLWLMSGGALFIRKKMIRSMLIIALFIGVLVSGSRGAIFFTVAMLSIFIISMFVSGIYKKISYKSLFFGFLFIIIAAYFTFPILERAYNANTHRIETASHAENVSKRIIETFMGSEETWENMSLIGHGIGAGSNAARRFMPESSNGFLLGEMEIDRILNEGGLLGILFELIKIILTLSALFISFRIMIREKNILPLLFWSYLTVQLLASSLTGQITVHAFLFLSLGIGWILLRSSEHRHSFVRHLS